MPVYRTDRHELDGQLVRTEQVDVTDEAMRLDIHAKARQALLTNRARITAIKPATAVAQASQAYDNSILALREINGIVKLLLALDGATDLLRDEAD